MPGALSDFFGIGATTQAIGDFGLGLFGNLMNYATARQTNTANKKLARENRAWMERMSNTAHQREVKDLRAAGLNPILSANGGAGAAVPSASTDAHQTAPSVDFSSMMSAVKGAAEIDNIQSATELNKQKAITEAHNATIRGIDAEKHSEQKSLGMEKAYQNARKAKADADVAYARAMFDTSPLGLSVYSAKQHNIAYPGSVSLSGKALKGFGVGSQVPAYLLRDFDSSSALELDYRSPYRYLSNKGLTFNIK